MVFFNCSGLQQGARGSECQKSCRSEDSECVSGSMCYSRAAEGAQRLGWDQHVEGGSVVSCLLWRYSTEERLCLLPASRWGFLICVILLRPIYTGFVESFKDEFWSHYPQISHPDFRLLIWCLIWETHIIPTVPMLKWWPRRLNVRNVCLVTIYRRTREPNGDGAYCPLMKACIWSIMNVK